MMLRQSLITAGLCAGISVLVSMPSPASAGKVLEAVLARKAVRCGIVSSAPGLSELKDGTWRGMLPDYCRAMAAAVFGDPASVQIVPVVFQNQFPALRSGEVDIVTDTTTNTIGRTMTLGIDFIPTLLSGQTFLVRKSPDLTKPEDLAGANICITQGTTSEANMADYFGARRLSVRSVSFDTGAATREAFRSERCDAMISEPTTLGPIRAALPNPDQYVIMSELISKEPLGFLVRDDDPEWRHIAQGVVSAIVQAEELDITKSNVDQAKATSTNAVVQRFLGVTPSSMVPPSTPMPRDWAYRVIKAVGNLGEIWDRSLGADSPFKLDRGPNKPWNKGGVLFAPAWR